MNHAIIIPVKLVKLILKKALKIDQRANFDNMITRLPRKIPKIDLILDIGAGSGTPILYETYPLADIVMFEPLEEFQGKLNLLAVKSIGRNIEIIQKAVSNKKIDLMYKHEDLYGSTLCEENEKNLNINQIRIKSIKLDELFNRYKNYSNILIKVDVQGAEMDVLLSGKEFIKKAKAVILECSIHNYFNQDVLISTLVCFMKENGFEILDIGSFSYRPIDGDLAQVDIVFLRKKDFDEIPAIFANLEQRRTLNQKFKKYNIRELRS